MPGLTVACPKAQRGTGQEEGGRGGGREEEEEGACKWMEEAKEDGQGERPPSSNQTPAARQPRQTSWSQTLRALLRPGRGWCSFALAGAVWSVCQVDAPPHPSWWLADASWRLLSVCLLWTVLGGCVHGLRCCLRPGQDQFKGNPPLRMQQEAVTESRANSSWTSRPRGPRCDGPLALALADSLLLCVLQEPLSDPSVPHIKTLLSRLESVSRTLEKADAGSEATPGEVDRDSALTDKVKLIRGYLQQRMGSLRGLVRLQGDFDVGVKDMLEGLDGLWSRLEELHTGVTLTKEGGRGGRGDLASAWADAETLFAVLSHYRNRLQCCQAHLKDSTLLLQELTWSHAHASNTVSGRSESVWPELLLQSNMEQFDKVQESFLAVEQQTSTFQAHLEGLGNGSEEGHHTGPLAHANGARSWPVSPQASPRLRSGRTSAASLESRNSSPGPVSSSVSSMDTCTDAEDGPLTLCERSALQFSSTIGRLRKSGRRK